MDPHVVREKFNTGEKEYEMTTVGLVHMATSRDKIDFNPVTDEIKKMIKSSELKLEGGWHWMKVVYGQNNNKPIVSSVTFDNGGHDKLTKQIRKSEWPEAEGFYMGKQFFMFRPVVKKQAESNK